MHRDLASISGANMIPIQQSLPETGEDGAKYETEYGLCQYKDCQRFFLQEMPERAPTGQLPRSVEILCEEDLVDLAKPGDRVKVYGVYRSLTGLNGENMITGHFKTVIISNHIEQLRKEVSDPNYTPEDIRNIKMIAESPGTFDLLSSSFAPSVCGHEYVKRGLLLLLLGGSEKNLTNGTHIRGDVHILLIGDPSCGKSQMLRFVLGMAPLSVSTTGRGSSGVGLTAAVTFDKDSGERRLEAGAMVLADRGVVCIDEFDKMSHQDRVAIHEVMEQQTVTVAKAGIHCSLNARASVVAAANPIYGTFDAELELSKQIAFPDSLLSRFDLIFVIRDAMDQQMDRRIARHVLRQVRYRSNLANRLGDGREQAAAALTSVVIEPEADRNADEDADPFEKSNTEGQEATRVLKVDFVRKYIHYCKTRPPPSLTEEACKEISEFYADLRERCNVDQVTRRKKDETDEENRFRQEASGRKRHVGVTARTLEGMIRLATAHAKLKLKDTVDKADCEVAKILLLYTLLGEDNWDQYMERLNAPPPTAEEEEASLLAIGKSQKKKKTKVREKRPREENEEEEEQPTKRKLKSRNSPKGATPGGPPAVSETRFEKLKTLLGQLQSKAETQQLPVEQLQKELDTILDVSERFSPEELNEGLIKLDASNTIFYSDNVVWFM
eukprot:GHVL01040837.1.p1 GENE.GHVL01040837.1~~GHVL01040837.1.p1  ORF type:complete len:668 (+),score=140.63 GHVL01040837.1:417-2420(+)